MATWVPPPPCSGLLRAVGTGVGDGPVPGEVDERADEQGPTTTSPAPSDGLGGEFGIPPRREHASAETHDDADDLGGDASRQSDAAPSGRRQEAPEGGGPHDREATRASLPNSDVLPTMGLPLASPVVACPSCGTKNRLPVAARSHPRCAKCKTNLPWLVDAGDTDFAAAIDTRALVVVDLLGPVGTGRCRMIAPVINKLSRDMAGMVEGRQGQRVDEAPMIAQQYKAQHPMVLIMDGSLVVDTLIGANPTRRIAVASTSAGTSVSAPRGSSSLSRSRSRSGRVHGRGPWRGPCRGLVSTDAVVARIPRPLLGHSMQSGTPLLRRTGPCRGSSGRGVGARVLVIEVEHRLPELDLTRSLPTGS